MRTLNEALDYLYSFINYETDSSFPYLPLHYNVERTAKLLTLLGGPERDIRILHVAGTKGKGSVCAILNALLCAQRFPTGLFTSPHIERINERIVFNGAEIGDEELVELVSIFPPLVDTFSSDNKPTTFEILTAMAMSHFNRKGALYAVLETGMGGRFDSTNFADPVLSVITSISYDHTDKLGSRIEQIASEKAGIIKRGRPVVVGWQPYPVHEIFRRKAESLESTCFMAESLCSYEIESMSEAGTHFHAVVDGILLDDLFLHLPGRHQVENALSALLGLKVLGLLPGMCELRDALTTIRFPTRLELFRGQRRVLLDSAHNEDSARAVVCALREVYRYAKLFTVAGIVKGKDVRGILKELAAVSDELVITEPVTHKETNTDYVFQVAKELFSSVVLIRDVEEALSYAISRSGGDDLILVTGSFYTTSPARSFLIRRKIAI